MTPRTSTPGGAREGEDELAARRVEAHVADIGNAPASAYWYHDGQCAAAVAATLVRRTVRAERDAARAEAAGLRERLAAVEALTVNVYGQRPGYANVKVSTLRAALASSAPTDQGGAA